MYACERQKFRSPSSKLDQTAVSLCRGLDGKRGRLTVTLVVCLAAVIAQKLHGVALGDVLRVLLDEVWRELKRLGHPSGGLPLTVSQSVGIVSMYSNSDNVKPYTFFSSCMTRKGSYAAVSTGQEVQDERILNAHMSQKNLTDGSILQ